METNALLTDERLQLNFAIEEEPSIAMAGDDDNKEIRPLWPIKLHYFLHGAGGAPIFPFLSVFLKQKGMTGPELGTCFAGIQLISLVARPFIGGLMDKHPSHKIGIFRLLFFIHLLGYSGLWYVPPIHNDKPSFKINCNIDQSSDKSSFNVSLEHLKDPCVVEKLQNGYKSVNVDWKCKEDDHNAIHHSVFRGEQVTSEGQRVHLPFYHASSLNAICTRECTPTSSDKTLQEWLSAQSPSMSSLKLTLPFLMALSLMVVAGVAGGAVNSFQDAMCQQLLRSQPPHRQQSYGQQRLFASIGWGLSALVVGRLLDNASKGKLFYDYWWAFTIMGLAWSIDFLVVANMDFSVLNKGSKSSSNAASASSVWTMVFRRQTLLFLLFCVIAGVCYGALPYHFLLLEELGSNMSCDGARDLKLLQGLCLAVNCMGEIPVFFFSGRVLSKLGAQRVMLLPLLAFSVRFLYYSSLQSPWGTLLVEPLNGVCSGLVYSVLTVHAHDIAPKGMATTMVAVAFVVMEGVGNAGANIVAGKIFSSNGASALFRQFGLFVIAATFVLFILQRRFGSRLR